jgi:hypothetical protein
MLVLLTRLAQLKMLARSLLIETTIEMMILRMLLQVIVLDAPQIAFLFSTFRLIMNSIGSISILLIRSKLMRVSRTKCCCRAADAGQVNEIESLMQR